MYTVRSEGEGGGVGGAYSLTGMLYNEKVASNIAKDNLRRHTHILKWI